MVLEKRRTLQVKTLSEKERKDILEKIIKVIENEIQKEIKEPIYNINIVLSDDWPYMLDIELSVYTPLPDPNLDMKIENIFDRIESKIKNIFKEYGLEEIY